MTTFEDYIAENWDQAKVDGKAHFVKSISETNDSNRTDKMLALKKEAHSKMTSAKNSEQERKKWAVVHNHTIEHFEKQK